MNGRRVKANAALAPGSFRAVWPDEQKWKEPEDGSGTASQLISDACLPARSKTPLAKEEVAGVSIRGRCHKWANTAIIERHSKSLRL